MFKRNIASTIVDFFAGAQVALPTNVLGQSLTRNESLPRQCNSRGKGGKFTSKRSNAAQHQRDAKKRNNIRKHK